MSKVTGLKTGHSYILYGKMGSMKQFKPVSGSDFVINLIHAEVFTPTNPVDLIKMDRELKFMQTQGTFEYREIKK